MASTNRRRLSVAGETPPLPVRLSKSFKTLREIEGKGFCDFCGKKPRTLYSYLDGAADVPPAKFCNKGCLNDWVYSGLPLAPAGQVEEVEELRRTNQHLPASSQKTPRATRVA